MSDSKYSSYGKRLPETKKVVDSRTKQMEFKRKQARSIDQYSGNKSLLNSASQTFERVSYNSKDNSKDITFQPSKLPAIVDIMNLRASYTESEAVQMITELVKHGHSLEQVIRSKEKEIQRLEYVNKFLNLSIQNKEQLLTQTLDENRKLKELTLSIERKSPERRLQSAMSATSLFSPTSQHFKPNMSSQSFAKQAEFAPLDSVKMVSSPTSSDAKFSSPLKKSKSNLRSNREEKTRTSVLKMSEEELNHLYADNPNFCFLTDLFKTQDFFLQEISYFDKDKFVKMYNAVQTLREDHSGLKDMMFKLRRIIKATITMSTSLVIDEAISRIVEETCECLDCDRATTFIYDNMREELWSKAAKGSDATIRVPVNKGIVGHVFTKGEAVNIYNAYSDERFNKAIDIKTGYKTNTILTVPIKDDSLKVIGVLQAVNKKETNAVFNKDDETLLNILSNLAGVVLRNSLMYNEQLSFHNVLRSALDNGVALNSFHELHKLIPFAEGKLKGLMAIDKARVVLKFPRKSQLFSVLSDKTVETYPMNCGIIGKVVMTGEHENVTNGYNDPLYNGIVDIESSLPLLCVPIKHPITEKVLGALEIINSKGILGLSSIKRANVSPLDLQVLEFFSRNLAQAILNSYEWEREKAHSKGEAYFVDEEEKGRVSVINDVGLEKFKSIDRLSKKVSLQSKKSTKKIDANSSDSNTETSL